MAGQRLNPALRGAVVTAAAHGIRIHAPTSTTAASGWQEQRTWAHLNRDQQRETVALTEPAGPSPPSAAHTLVDLLRAAGAGELAHRLNADTRRLGDGEWGWTDVHPGAHPREPDPFAPPSSSAGLLLPPSSCCVDM